MKKIVLTTLALIGAATLVFAWKLQCERGELLVAREALAKERTRLSEELQHAETRMTTAVREQAMLEKRLGERQRKTLTSSSPTAAAKSGVSASGDQPTNLAADLAAKRKELEAIAKAKGQLRSLAEDRLACAKVYQSLFRSLRLTPEQIERFLDISARQHERVMDLGQMEREGLIGKDDAAVAKMRADGVAAEHADYRELLGEAGYRQMLDEQRKTTAREIVAAFAANALVAGAQIPADRLDRLVDAVSSAQIPGIGWRLGDGRYATWQFDPIDWDLADARVQPLLNETEWNVYKSHTIERASHRLRTLAYQARRMDDERQKAAPPVTKPGG